MKKIKFKGKVVVCVRRKNGKWEKREENKGINGFQIIIFSEFSLFLFPFLHMLHLTEVIRIIKEQRPLTQADRPQWPNVSIF
jgi:hypothetical protein